MISIADDGEIGFTLSNKEALVGVPCEVTMTDSSLVIHQGDLEIVSIYHVSDEFGDVIRAATGLCMMNYHA